MSGPIETISPLRSGATGLPFSASAVPGPHFSGLTIPPLSRSGSLSMVLTLPPSIKPSSKVPSWALKEAKRQFKVICSMLSANMVGEPLEWERQLRLDGDSESWLAVQVMPRSERSR